MIDQIAMVIGRHSGLTFDSLMKYLPEGTSKIDVIDCIQNNHVSNTRIRVSIFDSEFGKWSTDEVACEHYFLTDDGRMIYEAMEELDAYAQAE